MDKIYTPKKYELKESGNLIKDKSSKEGAEIKAKELAKVILPRNFNYKGYDIEVIEQPHWIIRKDNTLLVVKISASKNGNLLNVEDGVFEYVNPPIMVSDGTFYKGYNDLIKEEVAYANFVEEPEQALKEII